MARDLLRDAASELEQRGEDLMPPCHPDLVEPLVAWLRAEADSFDQEVRHTVHAGQSVEYVHGPAADVARVILGEQMP